MAELSGITAARGCLPSASDDRSPPQARTRRLSGGSAQPFAPPSFYYLIVPHTTARLIARALGLSIGGANVGAKLPATPSPKGAAGWRSA